MADHKLIVVGTTGDGSSTDAIRETLEKCSVVAGTKTLLAMVQNDFPDMTHIKHWIPITPVETCLRTIEKRIKDHSVLVFTSGDPLFYGLGKLLKKRFPDICIRFLPALSSMQLCFSRFAIPWEDARFVSLHGRPLSQLKQFLHCRKLFILTDKENNPTLIARYISGIVPADECAEYMMHIGENLGNSKEKLTAVSIKEATTMQFSQPNCIILCKKEHPAPAESICFGLKEEEIRHSRGLITKDEVRAAVLHALRIPAEGVFWDIGSGSGSISIEAARMNPGISVFSIEHKSEEVRNITFNKNKFKCWNISVLRGRAPEILSGLAQPDRVFIGGSGGNMKEILEFVALNSTDECSVVITGVTTKTCTIAPQLLHQLGFSVDISIISTSRFRYPLAEQTNLNPIHIIRGIRSHEQR